METAITGGRLLQTGDENLLRLAHDTGSAFLATTPAMFLTYCGLVFMESAPVVIVLTEYDRLVRAKASKLQEDDPSVREDALRERSREEARRAFDTCIRSLEHTLRNTNTPKPPHVSISGIYFPLFIWIRVDLSPQSDQAAKLASHLLFTSLAALSVTSSS